MSATPMEITIAPMKSVSACRFLKFSTKFVDGQSTMSGLKMPLSGMVEKTNIIQSGNSQIIASGASAACNAIWRSRRDCDLDFISDPSRPRD